MENNEYLSSLANSMVERLQLIDNKASINLPCAINRVPPNIRQCKPDSYDPKLLSVGPYHYGECGLQAVEEHKWRYLHQVLVRNSSDDQSMHNIAMANELKKLLSVITEIATEARRCYPKSTSNIDQENFVIMLALDGCFLVELLIKFYRRETEDPLFAVAWILPLIRRDILKLENQIPFFVLELLFSLLKKPKYRSSSGKECDLPSLREIAFAYLTWKKCEDFPALSELDLHHLLHLYHVILLRKPETQLIVSMPKSRKSYLLPLFQSRSQVSDGSSEGSNKTRIIGDWSTSTIPSVTELREAGVSLKCKTTDSFIDVDFRNGVLEIPRLSVADATESLLRNLIAFEQCYPDVKKSMKHFTSYCLLMDCLVNSPRDVSILVESGIIENKLGSEEDVALLLNGLCKEIIIDYHHHHFANLFQRVNKYVGSKWNKNTARLRRDYFKNPWTSISVFAAAVLLGLNLIQTVFTVLSYIYKH